MRILRFYLLSLLLVYIAIAFDQTVRLPIWSPLDEIAHYDYIDQLSSGHIPYPTAPISDYTSELSIHHFNWIHSAEYNGTKETMGLSGISYEAQQPPLYYFVLAVPNYLLKELKTTPETQIKILRLSNSVLEILGILVSGLVISKIRYFRKIHLLWPVLVMIIMIIPNWGWRGALNNGNMSLLMVNLSIYFLIVHFSRIQDTRHAALSILFGSFAFLTTYTNILILGLVGGCVIFSLFLRARREKSLPSMVNMVKSIWPSVIILVYLVFNIYRFGVNNLLGSRQVEAMFSNNPITHWGLSLINLLLSTSFDIGYLPFPIHWPLFFQVGVALTMISVFWGISKHQTRSNLPFIVALGMTFLLIIFSWLMTKVSPTVDWGFFRHFSGYMLFFIVACFGFLIQNRMVEKVTIPLLSFLLTVPAFYYILQQL